MLRELYHSWAESRTELSVLEEEVLLNYALDHEERRLLSALLSWRSGSSRRERLVPRILASGSRLGITTLVKENLLSSEQVTDVLLRGECSLVCDVLEAEVRLSESLCKALWARNDVGLRLALLESRQSRHAPKSWRTWLLKARPFMAAGYGPESEDEVFARIAVGNPDLAEKVAKESKDLMVFLWIEEVRLRRDRHDSHGAARLCARMLAALQEPCSEELLDQMATCADFLVGRLGDVKRSLAGSPEAEMLLALVDARRARGLSDAGLEYLLTESQGGEAPLTRGDMVDALLRGELPASAVGLVSSEGPQSSLWEKVASHPELSAEAGAELLTSLEDRGLSGVSRSAYAQQVLASRDAAWLIKVAERTWRDGRFLSHSQRSLRVVVAQIETTARASLLNSWVSSASDLARVLEQLTDLVPDAVVLAAPLSWGHHHSEAAERFLLVARETLTRVEDWETFERLSAEFEGSFGELLAVSASLSADPATQP